MIELWIGLPLCGLCHDQLADAGDLTMRAISSASWARPQFWQRRTNVWREVTGPARGLRRLTKQANPTTDQPGLHHWVPGWRLGARVFSRRRSNRPAIQPMTINKIRKLLIIVTSLAAVTTASHANEEDQRPAITLESPLAITAKLAEYLTSCGGKAKPETELVAQKIIDRAGRQKWLETVWRIHVERDEPTLNKFCLETRMELDDLLDHTPPPGDLDLTPLPRRIT